MDRFRDGSVATLATPLTDAARFTVTKLDVGTEAIRAGLAVELERERNMLLAAARLALAHIRAGKLAIGSVHEFMLEQAIRAAEMPK